MPQMIAGRAVQGMGREFFVNGIFGANFGMEFLYTFVIVVCSLMVYFGTRELYELSSHKGIKYFRLAFLFFAIAYFFRSGLKFVLVYFGKNIFDISPRLFGPLSAGIFMYFSSMAVFFLLYSVMWKKWKDKETWNYVFQTIAILFAVISMVSRGNVIFLGIN